MSREKTRSHAARSTALVQTWIDQSETLLLFFAETNQRQMLLQGSPELLTPLLYMRRRALGRDWITQKQMFHGEGKEFDISSEYCSKYVRGQ